MEPPNPAAIDMRHTKLKASEAALIAGELVKPTWASRNEGIHERISFEDTLWGFEMAGGAFYKTPLRVAYVRPDSRAEHACIRMGDTVLRINGQDTSNLTLQQAHQLVLEAGINLKIVVTAPEDKTNAHYAYEDPVIEEPQLTPEQLKQMELERVRRALERASRCRDLPWPWVKRKWTIYRESNCFMVPSKYENKHREKFPELPSQRVQYFYPAEKKSQANNKDIKDIAKPLNVDKNVDDALKEDEEYEEVEEEVEEEEVEEEEVEEEEATKLKDDNVKQESSESLENKTSENNDTILEEQESNLSPEKSSDSLETELNNTHNDIIEDLQRKDSNNSASSYELDNNNNHVSKHKNEKTNEESSNNHSDDRMIEEIVQNSTGSQEENLTKSDDDIIDSVLNDNTGSNLENER